MEGGFFQYLTNARLKRGFARVKVSRRVVEHQSIGCVLFDQQILAVFFNDASDGDTGLPSVHHGAKSTLFQGAL
jgi:hypothetical protein